MRQGGGSFWQIEGDLRVDHWGVSSSEFTKMNGVENFRRIRSSLLQSNSTLASANLQDRLIICHE